MPPDPPGQGDSDVRSIEFDGPRRGDGTSRAGRGGTVISSPSPGGSGGNGTIGASTGPRPFGGRRKKTVPRPRKKRSVSFFRREVKPDPREAEVDPRLAERARQVRDRQERKAFKRALVLLLVGTLVGVGVWLTYSPYLAVRRLEVTGVVSSSVPGLLRRASVVEGAAMFSIDSQSLERTLSADPWVKDVEVDKRWPYTLRVTVEERTPVAWVLTAEGWRARSSDGVELEVDSEQVLPLVTGLTGAVLEDDHPSLESVLGFVDHLRSDLLLGTVVEIHGAQVTANVARRVVRLGKPTDLEEKANVLGVLIDHHTDPGSVINLFSAQRPAVYRGIDLSVN